MRRETQPVSSPAGAAAQRSREPRSPPSAPQGRRSRGTRPPHCRSPQACAGAALASRRRRGAEGGAGGRRAPRAPPPQADRGGRAPPPPLSSLTARRAPRCPPRLGSARLGPAGLRLTARCYCRRHFRPGTQLRASKGARAALRLNITNAQRARFPLVRAAQRAGEEASADWPEEGKTAEPACLLEEGCGFFLPPPPSPPPYLVGDARAAPRCLPERSGEGPCAQACCGGRALGPLAARVAEAAVGILSFCLAWSWEAGEDRVALSGWSDGRAGRASLSSGGGFFSAGRLAAGPASLRVFAEQGGEAASGFPPPGALAWLLQSLFPIPAGRERGRMSCPGSVLGYKVQSTEAR